MIVVHSILRSINGQLVVSWCFYSFLSFGFPYSSCPISTPFIPVIPLLMPLSPSLSVVIRYHYVSPLNFVFFTISLSTICLLLHACQYYSLFVTCCCCCRSCYGCCCCCCCCWCCCCCCYCCSCWCCCYCWCCCLLSLSFLLSQLSYRYHLNILKLCLIFVYSHCSKSVPSNSSWKF